MTGLKKQRNKNHWTLPYAGAAQRYEVHIRLVEDKSSACFGKYHVYCGAATEMVDPFEKAKKQALWFTHGGAL